MSYFENQDVIHLENNSEVKYWTKKWGVNVRQLYDAILETGSVNIKTIGHALQKNKTGTFSFIKQGLLRSLIWR